MRSLLTLFAVITVGASIALLTGLALPSFAAGVGYMLVAALLINSLPECECEVDEEWF